MARILFVSISFPPKSDAEGLQVAKYFRYLSKHKDLVFDVVTTPVPTLYMPFDADLLPYAEGVDQLIEIDLRESRIMNFMRARLGMSEFSFPDVKNSFHKNHKAVLGQIKKRPDLIYSRADPKSSTILAYHLKKYYNVPWILHMSDPWADCPIRKLKGTTYEMHDHWEKLCFTEANIISLTSLKTIDFYKAKYPEFEAKFRLFPNVYESNIEKSVRMNVSETGDKKFKLVYTGGLANERSPAFILQPLQELFTAIPSINDRIEVVFAGEMDLKNRSIFKSFNLPFVKWLGNISFSESRKLQNEADYLLAIDFIVDDNKYAMFFLSKLLDYMLAGKRILALTVKGSTTDEFVKELGGDSCHRNDIPAIKDAILKALQAYESKDISYLNRNTPNPKYEASFNADRLRNEMLSQLGFSKL